MGLLGIALGYVALFGTLGSIVVESKRFEVPMIYGRSIAAVTESGRVRHIEGVGVINSSVNIEHFVPNGRECGEAIFSDDRIGMSVQVFGLGRSQVVFFGSVERTHILEDIAFWEGVWSYIERTKSDGMESRRLTVVAHRNNNFHDVPGFESYEYWSLKKHIGSQLPLGRALGYIDHLESCPVGDNGHKEGCKNQNRASSNNPSLSLSRVGHTLRRFVHSSLSREVVYLPLTGFFFNALAGVFLGLFFHYLNRQRKWWPLLLSAGFACLGFWLIGIGLSLRS